MKKFILISLIIILLSSCNNEISNENNKIETSKTTKVIVTEKIPGLDCIEIENKQTYKCIIENNEVIVTEKVPGVKCENNVNTKYECTIIK
ncbi:MAG: hypothetical protein PHH98_05045 [Candidatus Gracilibacteria bacterium]|nr:hypothetical protein [Candidatus Gracilibacteria bacterium]